MDFDELWSTFAGAQIFDNDCRKNLCSRKKWTKVHQSPLPPVTRNSPTAAKFGWLCYDKKCLRCLLSNILLSGKVCQSSPNSGTKCPLVRPLPRQIHCATTWSMWLWDIRCRKFVLRKVDQHSPKSMTCYAQMPPHAKFHCTRSHYARVKCYKKFLHHYFDAPGDPMLKFINLGDDI